MTGGQNAGGGGPRLPRLIGKVVDFIARRTDGDGNGVQRTYYFRPCVIEDLELADSPLEQAVTELENRDRFQGGIMRWRYGKLIELRRTYDKTLEFVWEQVGARRKAGEEHNRSVGLEVEAERKVQDELQAEKDREVGSLEREVTRLKFEAVPPIAAAGGTPLSLSDPKSDCLQKPEPLSEQIVASQEKLPLDADEHHGTLNPMTVKAITAINGGVIAYSASAAFGASLDTPPGFDSLGGVVAAASFLGIGWGISTCTGWAAERWAKNATHEFCVGNRKSGVRWSVSAAALVGSLCVLDATVGQQGLFRSAAIDASINALGAGSTAHEPNNLGNVLFSYVFSVGYMAVHVGLGIISGRRAGMNRIVAARKEAHDKAVKEFTDKDEYRPASEAVAYVRLAERHRDQRVAYFDAKIRASEAREKELVETLRELQDGPDEHQAALLRDLHDDLVGNMMQFEADLLWAYHHARRPWYGRVWYWLFGWFYRHPLRKVRG